MTSTSKRGGARPGAGRPVSGNADYKVRLPPSVAELLKALGDGSLSAGILKLTDKLRIG
jgi:hypothetical protein